MLFETLVETQHLLRTDHLILSCMWTAAAADIAAGFVAGGVDEW